MVQYCSDFDGEYSPQNIAELLINQGVSVVVVTGAASGCFVSDGTVFFHVKAPLVHVVDANGAGAVLSAAFLYGLCHGWNLRKTCKFAVAAASMKCEIVGPLFAAIDEATALA